MIDVFDPLFIPVELRSKRCAKLKEMLTMAQSAVDDVARGKVTDPKKYWAATEAGAYGFFTGNIDKKCLDEISAMPGVSRAWIDKGGREDLRNSFTVFDHGPGDCRIQILQRRWIPFLNSFGPRCNAMHATTAWSFLYCVTESGVMRVE